MKKVYELKHLECAHCAAKMEERINRLPEITNAVISYPMKRLYVDTMKEDILSSLQEICSRIEPDIELLELDSAAEQRKARRQHAHSEHKHHHEHCSHEHEHHHEHCDCGEHEHHHEHCGHDHEHHHEHCDCGEHEHHHEHCGHDHEHHHEHCDCGHEHEHFHDHTPAAAVREGSGPAVVFLLENLG